MAYQLKAWPRRQWLQSQLENVAASEMAMAAAKATAINNIESQPKAKPALCGLEIA
jgi:hypothetical protein